MSGETLDVSCTLVRNRLTPPILRKLEGSSAQTSPSHGKLRNVIKSLLQLAANLSQSREFRDLFEDIITKVSFLSFFVLTILTCLIRSLNHWRRAD